MNSVQSLCMYVCVRKYSWVRSTRSPVVMQLHSIVVFSDLNCKTRAKGQVQYLMWVVTRHENNFSCLLDDAAAQINFFCFFITYLFFFFFLNCFFFILLDCCDDRGIVFLRLNQTRIVWRKRKVRTHDNQTKHFRWRTWSSLHYFECCTCRRSC
jgi:hypothetical protein